MLRTVLRLAISRIRRSRAPFTCGLHTRPMYIADEDLLVGFAHKACDHDAEGRSALIPGSHTCDQCASGSWTTALQAQVVAGARLM